MNVFELDSSFVAAHTTSLRRDASILQPLHPIVLPPKTPSPAYRAAITHALDWANWRAEAVSDEARRVAGAMDLTVGAADAVDGKTCTTLGGFL